MAPSKSDQIRRMFSAIAPRYDLLNHLLSANIDRIWRKHAVSLLKPELSGPSKRLCLDLCTGTGDLAISLARLTDLQVLACDFSHPMLEINRQKLIRKSLASRVFLAEADALCLPVPSDRFDAVTIAFGLRNLENLQAGLIEMRRVLKTGGSVLILEFSKPAHAWLGQLFDFYFFRVLPRVGNAVSRHNNAYTYLPESVKTFPDQRELAEIIRACGFEQVRYQNLTGGIAAIHIARKR
ncbi:MAG: bifunctional demethylmenaquinone methyltransferase/2-methoxy-6-polyprenyl-1,4-benzoquinol methylase UbiE [Acidobacteriota bacterium]